jgi:hypothetical protein
VAFGHLLCNLLVVLNIMWCLLMIGLDSLGDIHYIVNQKCLRTLSNSSSLLKTNSLQKSNKSNRMVEENIPQLNFNHFFLTMELIVHKKSCPYTSQQNGLTERKLRHILETRLTLLAHSHLSNRY